MATTSSWLTSLALSALCSIAQAGEAACPSEKGGERLASASVFDGPPSEHADLVPDRHRQTKDGSRSEWDVAYVFEAGRQLYVECRYRGNTEPVVIEPPPATTLCTFVTRHRGRSSLGCASPGAGQKQRG
ncbi:STY0301 family protein [Paucibacter sp. R3-3]|uniref:STY0301 family protein n=1 Tax=Roseateles agri TaxID=3098619 RepID=A0ABU5DDR4_9BURK|nr:STY0301 family protein [Paucibacter sp. R3-3]MDY0743307.1 STY0301 family protein [Paucibacter sp. R3-3]